MRPWSRVLLLTALFALVAADAPPTPAGLRGRSSSLESAPGAEELTVVVVTHSSAGNEVMKAFFAAVGGFFLVLFAFPVLWFNERREAHMWALFGRARRAALPDVASKAVDPANEARLVHVPGTASTEEVLRDEAFCVKVANCAKLQRSVQMYQWVEHQRHEERNTAMGGKERITYYEYTTEWCNHHVHSGNFKEPGHHNPAWLFESRTLVAGDVRLGAFHLPSELVNRMQAFRTMGSDELPPQASVQGVQLDLRGTGSDATFTTEVKGSVEPKIGDLRVTFQKVSCGAATVLAVQHRETLVPLTFAMRIEGGKVVRPSGPNEPLLASRATVDVLDDAAKPDRSGFDAPTGCCAACSSIGQAVEGNEEVFEIVEETLSVAEVLKRAQDKQECVHLGLQVVGFLMFFIGYTLMFSFVPALFRIIPLIGVGIQMFGNFIAAVAAFVMAIVCWCVTVSLAWFSARPTKAGWLLLAASLLICLPRIIALRDGTE